MLCCSAGLWEFPSVALEMSSPPADSQAALEAQLWGMPGCSQFQSLPRSWSQRQHTCSHLFSHISLTMQVHRLTLQAWPSP